VTSFSFLFSRHSSSLVCSEPYVALGVKAFVTAVSVCSFVLIYTFTLFAYGLGSFRTSSGVAGCVSTFDVDDDSSGESSKSQKFHSCYWKLLPP
jgi:hypothetical protein